MGVGLTTWAICRYMCRVRSGQYEEARGDHEQRETIPQFFSTSVMVYLMCRQGHETNGLMSPSKYNRWFIDAQSGAGLNDSQDHENGTMAEDIALWL